MHLTALSSSPEMSQSATMSHVKCIAIYQLLMRIFAYQMTGTKLIFKHLTHTSSSSFCSDALMQRWDCYGQSGLRQDGGCSGGDRPPPPARPLWPPQMQPPPAPIQAILLPLAQQCAVQMCAALQPANEGLIRFGSEVMMWRGVWKSKEEIECFRSRVGGNIFVVPTSSPVLKSLWASPFTPGRPAASCPSMTVPAPIAGLQSRHGPDCCCCLLWGCCGQPCLPKAASCCGCLPKGSFCMP